MSIKEKIQTYLGLNKERSAPPPNLLAVAPGLAVYTDKAVAWFRIRTSNSDLYSEGESDNEILSMIRGVSKILQDKDCHLKIVWSRISGEQYEKESELIYTAGDWRRWVADRADRIDDLLLPDRHILLGITIDSDRKSVTNNHVINSATDMLGIAGEGTSRRELDYYLGLIEKMARPLRQSKLGAQIASTEIIAWMIAREQRRDISVPPTTETITGASLHKLTAGRVVPYVDHLRFYDARGATSAYGSVLVMSDFPEIIETPGAAAWLLNLSSITRIDDRPGFEGDEVPVIADASIRFKLLSRKQTLKKLEDTRTLAREQRISAAKHSAEETSDEISESEQTTREMIYQVNREGLYLIEHHPRLTVVGATYDEMEANREAVIAHYAEMGITVAPADDEQRELWLETLPGDQVRVHDLGTIQTDVAFFASWFWGGSRVGDTSNAGAIGVTTGSTPGISRFNPLGGGLRGDATTTGIFGRSGRGKTTLIQMSCMEAGFQGAWVTLFDIKIEGAGLAHLANAYGLPAQVLRVGVEHSGSADLFNVFDRNAAPLAVARQLTLMAPKSMKGIAETVTLAAASTIAKSSFEKPSTWATIQLIAQSTSPETAALGAALIDLAQTPLGAAVAGPPSGKRVLREEPGVWVLQLPGLSLPGPQIQQDDWDANQRLSMAAMRAFMAHTMEVASQQHMRTMPKLIAWPEVHRLLRTEDGKDFLDQLARLGRALNANLMIDSQDATGISEIEGVVEQLSTVFGFQLTTATQQDALAELLHLDPNANTRDLIREMGFQMGTDGETEIRKGHCIYRDWRDNAAFVQIDLPTAEIQEMLSTNPDATATSVDLNYEDFELATTTVEAHS